MKHAIEVGKPDWRPLENAMPSELCDDYVVFEIMWRSESEHA